MTTPAAPENPLVAIYSKLYEARSTVQRNPAGALALFDEAMNEMHSYIQAMTSAEANARRVAEAIANGQTPDLKDLDAYLDTLPAEARAEAERWLASSSKPASTPKQD